MDRFFSRSGHLARILAALGLFTVLVSSHVAAQEAPNEVRLALVIAQTNYSGTLSRVEKAEYEAGKIAASLEATGFAVKRVHDLDKVGLEAALDDFRVQVDLAGENAVAFVYYTGHGVQHPDTGDSFLLGVDAKLQVKSDLAVYGSPLARHRDGFAATESKAVFLVFDACRNIPTLPGWKGSKGFSVERPASNILIAYSTDLGALAEEGVYAPILAEELARPGQRAAQAFDETQIRVKENTNPSQLPYVFGRIYNRICFAGCDASSSSATRVSAALLEQKKLGQTWDQVLMRSTKSARDLALDIVDTATKQPLPIVDGRVIIREGQAVSYRVQSGIAGKLIVVDWPEAQLEANDEIGLPFLLLYPNAFLSKETVTTVKAGSQLSLGDPSQGFRLVAQINDPSARVERGDLIAAIVPESFDTTMLIPPTKGLDLVLEPAPAAPPKLDGVFSTARISYEIRR